MKPPFSAPRNFSALPLLRALHRLLSTLCLAAAGLSAAPGCYQFSSTPNGVTLKVDITNTLEVIGPIPLSGGARSFSYVFTGNYTLTVGSSTQVSAGMAGASSILYSGSPLFTTVNFTLGDPSFQSDWLVNLQGSGDLLPNGLTPTLPPLSNWMLPGIGTQHDYISIGPTNTATNYQIDQISNCATAGGPTISFSVPDLVFSYTLGGAEPASQMVNVSNSGAAVSFTASATTASGSNWLAVTPSSGSTPGSLTVSVTATGLAAGSYTGNIKVTPSDSGIAAQSLPVTLTVTNGSTPPGAPTITGNIVNASGYQATLAPDTVFVIFGSNLGPATIAEGKAPNYPTSLAGTSVTFTPAGGGAPIDAKIVYTLNQQVAGLLPSSIAPGSYTAVVTYNNQSSAPQNVTVVARSFGIATVDSSGTGPAQATIGNVNGGISLVRFTNGSVKFGGFTWTLTPAHPGDTLVLWGTGGGADAANDTGGTSGDQTKAGNFIVTVDGVPITPLYAGASSGYPGLWQVNFKLPGNITPDCFASAQVSAGGNLSNPVSIAIAPAGENACSSPGFSAATLAKLDSGGKIVMASASIGKITQSAGFPTTATDVMDLVGGAFFRYTAAEWILPWSGPKFGPCIVFDVTYPAGGKYPGSPDSALDAGPKITLTGPNVPAGTTAPAVATPLGLIYSNTTLPAGTLKEGATYTLAATGGSQVAAFSVPVTLPSSFMVTNWASLAAIDRSKPLVINWTGDPSDDVVVLVAAAQATAAAVHQTVISCSVSSGLGTISISPAALAYLPAVAAGDQSSNAQLEVSATALPVVPVSSESGLSQSFLPNLVGGGQADYGAAAGTLEVHQPVIIK